MSLQPHRNWQDDLNSFPILEPVDARLMITSEAELVFAISQQHWALLAKQPLAKTVAQFPNAQKQRYEDGSVGWPSAKLSCRLTKPVSHVQHPLVAAIVGGEGKPFILRRLLNCGFSPDLVDSVSGWPVLVIATYFGRMQAVSILLDAGAQPNASINVNGRLKTALGVAITTGYVDMVNLLILNGSNFYEVRFAAFQFQLFTIIVF